MKILSDRNLASVNGGACAMHLENPITGTVHDTNGQAGCQWAIGHNPAGESSQAGNVRRNTNPKRRWPAGSEFTPY